MNIMNYVRRFHITDEHISGLTWWPGRGWVRDGRVTHSLVR
jgi:hypothetical protein